MPPQTTGVAPSQLMRLSVQWESERIDVGVPGGVPVAEVLPSLTRRLRMLDGYSASSGFRLVQADGTTLNGDRTLAAQNVHDGDLLVLEQGAAGVVPKRYDDLVEAVADVVEHNAPAWSLQNAVTTATVVASVLLMLALVPAVWAWVADGTIITAAGSGAAALVLLICAVVMDRTKAPAQAAMALALVSAVYAGVAGYTATAFDGDGWGLRLVLGSAAMLVVGAITLLTLTRRREYGLIPVALGALLLIIAACVTWLDAPVAATLAAALAITGIAGLGAPWIALASVPLRVVSARDDSEVYDAPERISPEQVAALYARAHRYQVSLRIALCLVVLVATVPVVASGAWGLVLCTVVFLGMFLGTRQVYSRFDIIAVAAGVLSGVALAVVAVVLTHPEWIGALVIALAVASVCIIVIVLLGSAARLRLTRVADFAEWAAIALLLPLAIIAGGWF